MEVGQLYNQSEERTRRQLEWAIQGTPYRIHGHQRLNQFLAETAGKELTARERSFLRNPYSEFDFVVWDHATKLPAFCVEFDGPTHSEPKQQERDTVKNTLCRRAGIPLLRVTDLELDRHDRRSLLEFIVRRHVAWRRQGPRIADECYEAAKDAPLPEDLEDCYEPMYDPAWVFDMRNPFPEIRPLVRRLRRDFGIVVNETPGGGVLYPYESDLKCEVFSFSGPDGGDGVNAWAQYRVFRETGGVRLWRGRLAVEEENIEEGRAHFWMRWELPTLQDHPFILYPFLSDLTGASVPEIARWYVTFLGLRRVEEWALRTVGGGSDYAS